MYSDNWTWPPPRELRKSLLTYSIVFNCIYLDLEQFGPYLSNSYKNVMQQ